MSCFEPFDTPEYRRMQINRRIHRLPAEVPGAVAVHLAFSERAYVFNHGSLEISMFVAEHLAENLIQQWDRENPAAFIKNAAILTPITALEAQSVNPDQGECRRRQYQADHALIVSACFDSIRYSDDPEVRVEAARQLQRVGCTPRPEIM